MRAFTTKPAPCPRIPRHFGRLRLGGPIRLVLWMLLASAPGWARGATASEYELKAAFLFNFARFIEWPQKVLPAPDQPLIIGIVGDEPFEQSLDALISHETVNGHALAVRRFNWQDDVTACHVLYISRSEAAHLPSILKQLRGKAVLTVSDAERFAYDGGMIGLAKDQGRLRLQINLDRVRDAQLVISVKLLRPALVIRDHPQSMQMHPWTWNVCASALLSGKRIFARLTLVADLAAE